LTFMTILVNDKKIMGNYVNSKVQNIISIITVLFIISLSAVLLVSPLFA
jgi:Mn2+/Fe2+ NRAMP family transporter